jgi:outer membrane protein assembly factor BamD (BamD/ComL family)
VENVEPPKPLFKRTPVLIAAAAVLAIGAWATVHFVGSSQPDSAVTRVKDSDNKAATSNPAPSATTSPAKPTPSPVEVQQRDAIALSDKLIASGDVTGALDTLKGAEKAGGPLTAEIRGREDTIAKLERNDAVAQLWVQATRELDQAQFTAAKRDLQKLAATDDGPRRAEARKDLEEVLPRRQKEETLFSQAERTARATDQKSQQRASNLLDQVIALDGPRKAEATNLQRQLSAKTASAKQDAGKLQNQNPPVTTPTVPAQTQQQTLIPQETKDWYQARDSNDASQLEQYLATYPNGSHAPDAQAKLQDLVWNRTRPDDISGLDAYVKRFPGSPHAQEATRKLDDLRWSKTNKSDSGELNDFLSRYPGSAHRSDAQAQLNQLAASSSAKAAAANANRTAANAVAPAVKPDAAPISKSNSEADVRATIQRYVDAFDNRDADALRAVWPTLGARYGKYKDSFRMASAIREQVTIDSVEISSDGTKATVRGQSALAYTGKSDKSPHTVGAKTVFQLAKSAGGWTITDVQ